MSLSDFLFNGKPPPAVTTYGSRTESLPPWLSDYSQGLVNRANQAAAEPYTTYTGPRIAGFSPDQTAAQGAIRSNQGVWRPGLEAAGNAVSGAMPYATAAAESFPSHVSEYMNPYTQNVIDRARLEAKRTYDEDFMPALTNTFVGAGQYGSSAHEREALRGARELTEGLQSNANAALAQGYTTGADIFGADQYRKIQAGTLAGNLGMTEAQIAQMLQSSGYKDAAALSASGAEQQGQRQRNLDLGYQDFINQRDYTKNQIDWLNNVIKGVPTNKTSATTETKPYEGDFQPSGLAQVGSVLTAGKGVYDVLKDIGLFRVGGRVNSYMHC